MKFFYYLFLYLGLNFQLNLSHKNDVKILKKKVKIHQIKLQFEYKFGIEIKTTYKIIKTMTKP